jgi:fatty acid desaturase
LAVRYGTVSGRTVLAYAWVWFLLLGGFIQTVQYNGTQQGWSADASNLRELTKLPRGFWGMLWWLATLAALVYGGGVLLRVIDPLLSHG